MKIPEKLITRSLRPDPESDVFAGELFADLPARSRWRDPRAAP